MKLFAPRYNNIDLIGCAAFSLLLSRGQWILALVVAVAFAGLSVIANGAFKLRAMDRQWQQLAAHDRIAAIKKHRELFNTGLKEAVDAVNEYRSKEKK